MIQNHWYVIGTRLSISQESLKKVWEDSLDVDIHSRNVYCCCKMLAEWHQGEDNVTIKHFLNAVNIGPLGLDKKIDVIKRILLDESPDKSVFSAPSIAPDEIEKQYALMIVEVIKIISESDTDLNTFKQFLNQCKHSHTSKSKIDKEIYENSSQFSDLVDSLQNNGYITQTELSWLKCLVWDVANSEKALQVIERYEEMNIAHKLHWHNSEHLRGTYLMVKTNKDPASLHVNDISKVKSAAVKLANLDETDALFNSAGVGSVIMYWKVSDDIMIELPDTITLALRQICIVVGITHIGTIFKRKSTLVEVEQIKLVEQMKINCGKNAFSALSVCYTDKHVHSQ